MYINPKIESSYYQNDIGKTIYDWVIENKPNKVIEFGCLYGYSTVAIGLALKHLGHGKLKCYDLFDNYFKLEILNNDKNNCWNCDNCKINSNSNKIIKLWNVPEILILYFKRYA